MNNQEAIKSLENIVEYWTCRPTEAEAAKLAISALETIDLLQKRGLDVERLKNLDYHKEIVQRINFEDYMELKDEVEELREKQAPKKLLEIRKRRDFNGNVVSIIGKCPVCKVDNDLDNTCLYCKYCGQRLDRSVWDI